MPRDDTHDDSTSQASKPDSTEPIAESETNRIIEFTIPTDAFVLTETLQAMAETIVEFEQYIPTGDSEPLPYLWVLSDNVTEFETHTSSDPTVDTRSRVAMFDDGALYRIEWNATDDGILEWVRTRNVTLLQSEGEDEEWLLKLRVESSPLIADFRTYCTDHDIEYAIKRAYPLEEPKMGQFNVTGKQRDALVTALEMGYFEVPRETTLAEVADALGISTKSASERLRRGQTNLVSNSLTIGQPTALGLG